MNNVNNLKYMAKKTKKSESTYKYGYLVDFILKYLIAPIIVPIIVAIILSFIKLNTLKNEIQIQNSLIQNNEIKIKKLADTVILQKNIIREQNIEIKTLENKIGDIFSQIGNNNTQNIDKRKK